MLHYYSVHVFGKSTEGNKVGGGHCIRAKSKKRALEIREKHGISHPWGAKPIMGQFKIMIRQLDLRYKHNKEYLERRRKGFTGSIWYEDKEGNLQHE